MHPIPPRLTWPRPLWLHLSNAWSYCSLLPTAWLRSKHGSLFWMAAPAQAELQSLFANNDAKQIDVAIHLAQLAATQWQDFLKGLWLYQHHPVTRVASDWHVVWQRHSVALKCLRASTRSRRVPPVFLVPSLINRFAILDLHPRHSFARYLQDRGHDVYLLDWHHDTTAPMPADMTACVRDYLRPALKTLAVSPHVIGYCMGGTLGVLAAQQDPQAMRSLTLIATPWDFHAPDDRASKQFGQTLQAMQRAAPTDHVTAEWLQILFWQRDSLTAWRKFQSFARQDMQSDQAALFVLAEDWLNSGVDLPTALIADCATTWFLDNRLAGQDLAILASLPIQVVAAARDQLVPSASSLAITPHVPHANIRHYDTGHIGLFAGQSSQTTIWPQLHQFLAHHNAC